MQPHQERVILEKEELDLKRSKLGAFIGASIFQTLSVEEQGRLDRQLKIMSEYSSVLAERIAAF